MNAVCKRGSKPSSGFSLIELLIVVAIILVIAAIAIPNFLKSKMRANETSAVASLRVIVTAQATYQSTYDRGFAPDMDALGPPAPGTQASAAAADLIDAVLASKIKSGYSFVYAANDSDGDGKMDSYTVNANPVSPGQTGDKYFYADQKGVIRYALGGPAGPTSDPVPSK
jgi:prepilin-type N-terminal cleavage/methylation domain-containing protein